MAYKVVFRADTSTQGPTALTWEAGCPVRIVAIQVARDTQTGQAFLQTKVQNVSETTIGSYRAAFHVTFEDGSAQDVEAHPLDADIDPRKAHEPQAMALARGDVLSATGTVREVRASTGVWASSAPAAPVPTPAALSLSPEALAERSAQLAEIGIRLPAAAIPRAVAVHDGWWLCPCGQPNVRRATCCACKAPLSKLRSLENEDTLLKAANERRESEERRSKDERRLRELKAAEEQARRKKNRRLAIGGGVAAVVIVAAIALCTAVISPALHAAPFNEAATGQGGWVVTKVVRHDTLDGKGTGTSQYTLDDWGNAVEQTIAYDDDYFGSNETYQYRATSVDPSGLMTRVDGTGEADRTVTIDAKDEAGRPTQFTTENKAGNGTVTKVSYRGDGTVESKEVSYQPADSSGPKSTTTTLYDASGWMTSKKSTKDDGSSSSYLYTYEDGGNPHEINATEAYKTSSGSRYGSTTDIRYVLDDNGNVAKVYEDDELSAEYEYAYVENLSPWALAQSRLKQQ